MEVKPRGQERQEGQGTVHICASSDDRDHREDTVSLLRQQLAAKTEECYELKSKLENAEAAKAQILRNQVEMQDNFFKVMFV